MILVTGGAGFIGSNSVLDRLAESDEPVLTLDKLTYASEIEHELGWEPAETFETGIQKTVRWYIEHQDWVAHVQSGAYRDWLQTNYAGR